MMKTEKQQSRLVPKLRFPEFKDGPGWDKLPLSSISDVNPSNEGLPESFIYIDLESVTGGMLIERKEIARDTAPSRAQRLLRRKDIIYQTVRPYQRNNLFFDIDDGYEYVASTGYAQLRAHGCPEFLYQLLHTDSFVNNVLAQCTGSNYPAINSSALASLHVALPSKPEQQKIADCLGSLDDLIAAEGEKLEALRQHKQGLMQQLFPQPGETVPRLRFPEFENGGGWNIATLRHLLTIPATYGIVKAGEYLADGVPMVRGGDIKEGSVNIDLPLVSHDVHEQYDRTCLSRNDVVIALVGYPGEAAVIPDALVGANISRAVGLLRVTPQLNPHYLAVYLNSPAGRKNVLKPSAGSAQVVVNLSELNALQIPVPKKEEQQRIADALSSLDDRIAAQACRIEALKAHKQGLLQQLFPSPEGNE